MEVLNQSWNIEELSVVQENPASISSEKRKLNHGVPMNGNDFLLAGNSISATKWMEAPLCPRFEMK